MIHLALPCGCAETTFMGQKRPNLCEHGNLFVKVDESGGSKPLPKPLKRTRRRETAAEKKARLRFNDVVKGWPCWFRATRPCEVCGGDGQVQSIEIEPDCCGKLNSAGECRGDCAIPKEVQEIDVCPACEGDGKHHCGYPKDAHHLIPKDFIRQRFRGITTEEQLLVVLFNPLIGAPLCRKAHDSVEAGSDRIWWEDLSDECLEYVSSLPDFMLLRLELECPKRDLQPPPKQNQEAAIGLPGRSSR